MRLEEIARRAGEELGFPTKLVLNTYKAYWEVIKQKLESLPLKMDITKEELDSLQTSINVPSLGKLYVDKDSFFIKKQYHAQYLNETQHKEDTSS